MLIEKYVELTDSTKKKYLDSKKLMPMAWTHESTYFQIKTMKEIISVNNSSKLIATINSVYGQNSADFICDLQNIWP